MRFDHFVRTIRRAFGRAANNITFIRPNGHAILSAVYPGRADSDAPDGDEIRISISDDGYWFARLAVLDPDAEYRSCDDTESGWLNSLAQALNEIRPAVERRRKQREAEAADGIRQANTFFTDVYGHRGSPTQTTNDTNDNEE